MRTPSEDAPVFRRRKKKENGVTGKGKKKGDPPFRTEAAFYLDKMGKKRGGGEEFSNK